MVQDLNNLNLIKLYVNISNAALTKSENHSYLLSVKSVLNVLASDSTVSFRVADGESVSDEVFTTRFIDGQFTPVQKKSDDEDADSVYILQHSFLEEVVKNADNYIDNPVKLNWGWIKDV